MSSASTNPQEAEAAEEALRFREATWQDWFGQAPSWLVSMLVHGAGLLILALLTLPSPGEFLRNLVLTSEAEGPDLVEDFNFEELADVEATEEPADLAADISAEVPVESLEVAPVDVMSAARTVVDLADVGAEAALQSNLMREATGVNHMALEGRGDAARAALVRKRGGTAESEQAVAAALEWIARHQLRDGSWSLDHTEVGCRCRNPGQRAPSYNAATALALLPMLGSGQTHTTGKYQETVAAGLSYLIRSGKPDRGGLSWHEPAGQMYSHGLVAIVLCEAYAMTRDSELYKPAQGAVDFIVAAQDPVGGGWRYKPGQAGDTSVTGWQVMALKSGAMGYLDVPPTSVRGITVFLDSVQRDRGAGYGYKDSGSGGKGTNAIGLLCRMYLGHEREHPSIVAGVKQLARLGPDPEDVYFDYYATQVLSQYDGELWRTWNEKMRDSLVATQAADGHEKGSWALPDQRNHSTNPGGRLCCTSLACMTLEVYYRFMPLYTQKSTEEEFPD